MQITIEIKPEEAAEFMAAFFKNVPVATPTYPVTWPANWPSFWNAFGASATSKAGGGE